jgi:DNA-binding NarL/FixJ family response regulator
LQTGIDFVPIETEGAIAAPGHPERLRLLPSVDSPGIAQHFGSLRNEGSLLVLPLAPAQSLASRIRRLRPDIAVIASYNLESTPWRHDSSLRDALASTPAILLAPAVTGSASRIAVELGIASLLPLDLQHDQLVAAIHAAGAGLTVTMRSPAEYDRRSKTPAEKNLRGVSLVEPLTQRERAVLDRMAHGCGNKEIAAQLNISDHTVKFHVSSILAKLGAASRTEAVTIGILSGLVAI